MGVLCGQEGKRHNESYIQGSDLKKVNKYLSQVAKSICKIIIENTYGSGFFIKFDMGKNDFHCLMSNEHVIDESTIKQQETINVNYDYSQKNLRIQLNPKLRYIKSFKKMDSYEIDATVVQILPEDNISYEYFLEIDMNYLNKEKCVNLKGKEVFIPQFPKQEDLSYSSGKIGVIEDNYEFSHLATTDFGSSGSPIFLINNTKVIGIHKAGSKKENYGDFIWPIYDFLKNDIKLKKFLFNTNIFDKVNISTSRNGYGKSSYDNGDNYVGNLREGIPNGRGALYDRRNNKKFEGNFIDGEPVNGIYYYENGEYYKGPLNNKLQQGIGQLFYSDGNLKYEGKFEKGIKEGKGKYFYENGEYYEGDFHNNQMHGKGKLFYANNNIYYEGDFYENEKHGNGILYDKNGSKVYEGDFAENKFNGKGKYIYENGNYYIGSFKNNKKNGYGEIYNKNGDIIYEGDFARDVFEGEGKYVYDDGSYYVGKFKNGNKHGMGTMYLEDGKVDYEGKFENDKFIKEDN